MTWPFANLMAVPVPVTPSVPDIEFDWNTIPEEKAAPLFTIPIATDAVAAPATPPPEAIHKAFVIPTGAKFANGFVEITLPWLTISISIP